MKKIMIMCMATLMILCGLTACGNAEQKEDVRDSLASASGEETEEQEEAANLQETADAQKTEETEPSKSEKERTFPEPVYGDTRIRLSWGENKEIIVRLIDNDATADLVSKLPVSLPFEDYRGFQRDAILDLDPGSAPSQCDVFTGDFAYYDPWSHLTFFCEDFGYSRDLTPLGTIESGLEFLEGIDDGSDVLIEVVEQEE